MKFIQTQKAPSAIGPYWSDELLSENVGIQAVRVLENLKAVLEEAGSSMDSVIKTTIFLADMDSFAIVNEVYEKAFGDHKPARSTVAVKTLPKNALVEIDAVAVVNDYTF